MLCVKVGSICAVAYIAKVRILEQITTYECCLSSYCCCCLYRKGKNFRANHNGFVPRYSCYKAVAYIAKVRILEQITTAPYGLFDDLRLLLISQR